MTLLLPLPWLSLLLELKLGTRAVPSCTQVVVVVMVGSACTATRVWKMLTSNTRSTPEIGVENIVDG